MRLNIKFLLIIIILLLLFSCVAERTQSEVSEPRIGSLDLSGWDPAIDAPVKLEGEWELYWNKFYSYDDFSAGNIDLSTRLYSEFKEWNSLSLDGEKLGGQGYGTYRIVISLKNNPGPLALHISSIASAYELEINGEIVRTVGTIGRVKEDSIPDSIQVHLPIPETNRIEMILRISNFHQRVGGPWQKIVMGSDKRILRRIERQSQQDYFMLGAFIIMSLSYASLFFTRKSEKVNRNFSLFCLIMALRILVQGDAPYLLQYFPSLSWKIRYGLEYLTVYGGLVFFMLFIGSLFQDRFFKIELKITAVIAVIFTFSAFTLPMLINSWLLSTFQISLLASGIHIIFILISKFRQNNKNALVLLVGGVILFITVINDILVSKSIIESIYLIPFGMLIFILFQDHVLSTQFDEINTMLMSQKKRLELTNMEYLKEIETRLIVEEELKLSNENLLLARSAIIHGLAKIAEHRDTDTGAHLSRIQEFNNLLALELSKKEIYKTYITEEYLEDLFLSSILHDIGKVGVPDSILLKPGKLSSREFKEIQAHTLIGGDTLASIEKKIHVQTFLTLAKDIAYMHHEKWDGTGYPYGLKGDAIPLSARITAVSDVYDALTSERVYKTAFSHEKSMEMIISESGRHFDPVIIESFIVVHHIFKELKLKIA